MLQSKRSDAVSSIIGLNLRQQKLRANCKFYAAAVAAADACGDTAAATTVAYPANSEEGYYTLALSNASGNSYTITASAAGTQANDTACANITLTVNAANPGGLKQPAECW